MSGSWDAFLRALVYQAHSRRPFAWEDFTAGREIVDEWVAWPLVEYGSQADDGRRLELAIGLDSLSYLEQLADWLDAKGIR